MIRRLPTYSVVFGDEDPLVHILAPSPERPVPAGDTRRGTAWIFRSQATAVRFADYVRERHGVTTVAIAVRLRELARALADRDLTYVLDPEPMPGHGNPFAFKAPLAN